jgi:ribonuclease P/MRP protein subunit RPP1
MYEAVNARPDGDSTVSRFAETAARYGYDGLVVRSRAACRETDLDAVGAEFDLDVVDAVEIVADSPEQASGAVGNFRRDHTVVCVRGGTNRLNRFAVEQPRVDVLTRPMSGAGDVNHVLATAAARNGVRVEFDLGPVLRSNGGPRVQALSDLRKLRELLADADAPFVVSANARSHLHLRAPRDLAAVGRVVGFDGETIEAGLAEWGRLAERNRDRRSDSFVEPGVRVSDCPTEER